MSEINVNAERRDAADRLLTDAMMRTTPGPAQVSPRTIKKISRHDGLLYTGPAREGLLVDHSISGTPAIILPLPTPAATLTASIELLESLAATMNLPGTGSAVLHASDTPHQILLRWVTT